MTHFLDPVGSGERCTMARRRCAYGACRLAGLTRRGSTRFFLGWISKSTYDMLRKFEALDVELLESLEVTLQRGLWQQTWRYGIAKNMGTLGDVLYLESRRDG